MCTEQALPGDFIFTTHLTNPMEPSNPEQPPCPGLLFLPPKPIPVFGPPYSYPWTKDTRWTKDTSPKSSPHFPSMTPPPGSPPPQPHFWNICSSVLSFLIWTEGPSFPK